MPEPIWTPSAERVREANLSAFAAHLRERFDIPGAPADYAALHRWSVEHPEDFWEAAWADAGVAVSAPHTAVLTTRDMPVVRMEADRQWFPGTRFNFAQHLLRVRDDRVALIAESESGPQRRVTFRELAALVACAQAGLKALGISAGDRVAAYLPNSIEAVVAMLAATSLGAVFSSSSPDFGYQGVLERFGQIDPKVLFCTDGYRYNGKAHGSAEKAAELARHIPSIRQVVLVPFLDAEAQPSGAAVSWETFLASGGKGAPGEPEFPQFPFDHPLFVMYSSGTTGKPKCIVHGAGGTLLKHHLEHKFHTDLGPQDRLFFFTTCGWMMWNWLATALAQGTTLVLYDGSPAYPDLGFLFRMAERLGITVFGTSPKFLASCRNAELEPGRDQDLSALRAVVSTGAPLEPELFDWVYRHIKADLQLASISGGTDIIGCFMLGNPWQPVYRGEIQAAGLGVDAAAYDEAGTPVLGQKGELVCRQPIPSMPIGFWNDPDGTAFRAAYFERFPGVWHHGDFVEFNERGGVVVYGRSDATLNPGGVRIGTAEIYRIVEAVPEIEDSLVVGQTWQGDVRILLFVVPRSGVTLDRELEGRIRQAIREQATPRHVPARILPIREVPVTLNGKKVELAVTRVLEGREVTNRDALANPESLGQFESLPLD